MSDEATKAAAPKTYADGLRDAGEYAKQRAQLSGSRCSIWTLQDVAEDLVALATKAEREAKEAAA